MGKRLHELFEDRLRVSPLSTAVCAGGEQITYQALDDRASQLARLLRQLGVKPDVLVGLYIDRSIELIVGMLAILKAGGAYVPIDPAYPQNRVQFLIRDSQVVAVVSVPALAQGLSELGVRVVCEEDAREALLTQGDAPHAAAADRSLAYVMYTSGTTGQPKGVLIEHRSVVRLFAQTAHLFAFGPTDVFTMFHSPSFDFSVWEIWGALLHGGRLVIVPASVARSPHDFSRLLRTEHVTILNQTPSAFHQLAQVERSTEQMPVLALRLIIFGGEKLRPAILTSWFARHGDAQPALVNMYGITETTVHVTHKRLQEQPLRGSEESLIGEPIPDLQIFLLDPAGREVSVDVPGELHVAGPGLARGYLHRPTLTAERFIEWTGPDGAPMRLYRSGDLAMRRRDGELVYLGRSDDQVKVRGFRIEPAEIEACLLAHPAVAQAQVLVRDFGACDLRLAAFVVGATGHPDLRVPGDLVRALREKAARDLPPHMIPSQILLVDGIPLTAHGKADASALLRLAEEPPGRAAERAQGLPPAVLSETEQQVEAIIREVLQRSPLGLNDSLVAAGLTSLAMIRILFHINQRFGVSLTAHALGAEPSIAVLAAQVEEAMQGAPLERREP